MERLRPRPHEFEGHVLLVGGWGDQSGTPATGVNTGEVYHAIFKGTMTEFWATLYPEAFSRNRLNFDLNTYLVPANGGSISDLAKPLGLATWRDQRCTASNALAPY
jgi:hypothetical protein